MRDIEVTLGGKELRLAADFKASLEIAKKVGDPLTIMREAALETALISRGIPYDPKWRFTVENVLELIHIGTQRADQRISRDEIGELIFAAGFLAAKEVASDYLAIIVGPRPEEIGEKGSGEGN